jgi:glutamyl-tRNA synthetase
MDGQQTLAALEGAARVLADVSSDFEESAMEAALRSLAQELGLYDGQVFMPVRVAISGRTATPGIFETMRVLGKERVLRRIKAAIEVLK